MLSILKTTLTGLLSSKKAVSAIVAVLAIVGVRFLGLDEATATNASMQIMGVAAALILGQGAADLGKEGKKTEAEMIAKLELSEGPDPL